jgi:hypothetical protein
MQKYKPEIYQSLGSDDIYSGELTGIAVAAKTVPSQCFDRLKHQWLNQSNGNGAVEIRCKPLFHDTIPIFQYDDNLS